MKSFLNFLTEAKESNAVVQARRLGLKTDGHGGWYDTQGEFVAKTEKGELHFYDKGQRVGEKDRPKHPLGTATPASKKPINSPEVRRSPAAVKDPSGASKRVDQPLTVAFGRFNPPTTGHKKLLDFGSKAAAGGEYKIYPSRTNDPKKNPLDPGTKIEYMKKMFSNYEDNIVDNKDMKSIFDVLRSADEDGFEEITIVVGSDRLAEFKNLANKYNGDLYDFSQINVISAGERDDDSDAVEGMSGSKQRKAAADDDIEAFKRGLPKNMDDGDVSALFAAVQKGMKLTKKAEDKKETWQIAPKFDQITLREKYLQKKIFKLGDLVESLHTGLIGRVMRRGANHLICLTREGFMFKSWIRDVSEAYTEKKMDRKERVPGKPNTLVGTTGYLNNAMAMTGTTGIINFINKYKAKK